MEHLIVGVIVGAAVLAVANRLVKKVRNTWSLNPAPSSTCAGCSGCNGASPPSGCGSGAPPDAKSGFNPHVDCCHGDLHD